jgi:hypothetical protein
MRTERTESQSHQINTENLITDDTCTKCPDCGTETGEAHKNDCVGSERAESALTGEPSTHECEPLVLEDDDFLAALEALCVDSTDKSKCDKCWRCGPDVGVVRVPPEFEISGMICDDCWQPSECERLQIREAMSHHLAASYFLDEDSALDPDGLFVDHSWKIEQWRRSVGALEELSHWYSRIGREAVKSICRDLLETSEARHRELDRRINEGGEEWNREFGSDKSGTDNREVDWATNGF